MIEFSVRRPVAVIMICIGLAALGLIAAKRIPVQLLPNIQTPEFTVVTNLRGATPEEIETLITIPIERAVSTIGGLERTSSTSERERSEVRLNFKSNINYLETVSVLRERLDGAGLPDGSSKPKILRFQANALPVVRLAIRPTNPATPPLETAQLIRDVLQRKLESVDGVALTTLLGAPEKKLAISIDPVALQSFAVPLTSIPEIIRNANRTFPAGEISYEGRRTGVKLGVSLDSIDELKRLTVKKDGWRQTRLEDIASIEEVTEKPAVRTHLRGEDSFVIDVKKESEANTVEVAEAVKVALAEFFEEYGDKVQGSLLLDQGTQIKAAIDNVSHSVIEGGVLAGLIIFLLIQNWWPTFVVSLSMPISILITFILMYFTGISFNLMSLAGLALGVGMLVDNSTVVLDNIHLLQSRLNDRRSAALWGTRGVVGAITGSTLSTIAVFGPMAFVDGFIGQMFRDVAATVCYALIASLFSAVFLIPMLSAIELAPRTASKDTKNPERFQEQWQNYLARSFYTGRLTSYFQDFLTKTSLLTRLIALWGAELALGVTRAPLSRVIARAREVIEGAVKPTLQAISAWLYNLEQSLKRLIPQILVSSGRTIKWSVGLTIVGAFFLMWRGAELFPEESADRVVFDIEFAPGQSIDLTEKRVSELERKLMLIKGAEAISSTIGEPGSHQAKLMFQVDEGESVIVARQLSYALSQEPGLTFNRTKDAMVGEGKPIQVEIYNDDLGALRQQARAVKDSLAQLNELADLESNIKADLSEIVIEFSKERLSWYGATPDAFVSTLRPMLSGQNAGMLQIKGEEMPVQVRVPASYFDSVERVKFLNLPQEDDRRLFLSQVSTVGEHKILPSIKRFNRKRLAVISANPASGTDLESATHKIRTTLNQQFKSESLNWKMGGQDEERARSQKSLLMAVGLSIFLIYLLLAAQFESLVQPVIVLCAVPLCISGVALLLLLFNMNLSALVFVGFIILVGASVNTSIVMVDFANQMVTEGRSLSEAISEATVRRMRPILVTTLSGIFGLLPMAFAIGQGAAMQQPLAVTLIGGTLSSTVLTMLVVPIIYVRLAKGMKRETA